MTSKPLLKAENLHVTFERKTGELPWQKPRILHAVNGVNFELRAGETLGIVGESGSGKSTLARAIIRMLDASGSVIWQGNTDLLRLSPREMLKHRADIQMIFQDPLASLNPRMTVGQIISETLITHHHGLSSKEIKARVQSAMDQVGLLPSLINRYPHEFSGGQCQRIGIARALIVEPKLIICDEPVSALDVSIQAQVINLLMDLQKNLGLALIFIAHDLSVVKHISTRVMVMYLGRTVEIADRDTLYANPQHPYTQALLSAIPIPDPKLEREKIVIPLEGELPSPMSPPSGCVFRTRCPRAQARCAAEVPALQGNGHAVACHFPGAV
ncbi:ABC transporter ATP-binding protein [Agrobacterium vitis]|uniref:ABC transporter ATP-binding protein n=1 Tax=Agrobacterium vitis TaxID=373 RepID=UPI000871C7BE|nr:oligopeptide/dipeptide ABC transporter ATP-binding protein [Agrobacterium vitis]MCE6076917.1 ATP-binding cassette domain-containing protein [Agrobacterium vitis]MCM2449665.1 ATP-binding cassette domain-containing protein [Agrobacterium vitis]MUO71762.1 ATP-binding cassette domain-containing protein [Agrobacterium vitis]MUO86160.1 ATP-binding cassette domain-containing protein [Agrobacterium vitis]MVA36858.1 ATP-binding cassette domain-containing protein [Agrobacterium vitis]